MGRSYIEIKPRRRMSEARQPRRRVHNIAEANAYSAPDTASGGTSDNIQDNIPDSSLYTAPGTREAGKKPEFIIGVGWRNSVSVPGGASRRSAARRPAMHTAATVVHTAVVEHKKDAVHIAHVTPPSAAVSSADAATAVHSVQSAFGISADPGPAESAVSQKETAAGRGGAQSEGRKILVTRKGRRPTAVRQIPIEIPDIYAVAGSKARTEAAEAVERSEAAVPVTVGDEAATAEYNNKPKAYEQEAKDSEAAVNKEKVHAEPESGCSSKSEPWVGEEFVKDEPVKVPEEAVSEDAETDENETSSEASEIAAETETTSGSSPVTEEAQSEPAASDNKAIPPKASSSTEAEIPSEVSLTIGSEAQQQTSAAVKTEESPESESAAAEKPKRHIIRKLLAAAIVLVAAAYGGGVYFFSSHFLPNTSFEGVELSFLDADQAEQKLNSEFSFDSMTLSGRTGDETLDLSDTDENIAFSSIESSIEVQNRLTWPTAFFDDNTAQQLSVSISCDEEMLDAKVDGLALLDPANITKPEDAHAVLNQDTGVYELAAESEGNDIDADALKQAVKEALSAGSRELDLEEAGVYREPVLRADNTVLTDQVDWMNSLNLAGATLDLDAGVVIAVNGELISGLVGSDGMADEALVRSYVSELAAAYNTSSEENVRTFINHNNEERTIKTTYGWLLNEDATANQLYELINRVIADTTVVNAADTETKNGTMDDASGDAEAEETVNTESTEMPDGASADMAAGASADAAAEQTQAAALDPANYAVKAVWKRAAASHEQNDMGSSYIEIDMGEQNVYVYIDGSCVLTTPCVTGRMTKGRMTPEGMYSIQYKQKSRYLVGRNSNGTISYRSFVNFWMPFNRGIGLHDATWRSKFGGDLYVKSGSHGCINLPLDMARQIYDICYTGMPVICYY